MEVASVDGGGKKPKFKPEMPAPYAGDKLLKNNKPGTPIIKRLRSQSPDNKTNPKFYLPPGSPVLEVKSRFTFGTSECLHSEEQISEKDGGLAKTSLLSQQKFHDVGANIPKTVPFGRSRRMSKSLPELRDLQFVSVLPDVEEEESETSEFQEEIVYEKPAHRVPWHRKLDFLWCSVCHALGFSNIWRFPYYCYSNGGGKNYFNYLSEFCDIIFYLFILFCCLFIW